MRPFIATLLLAAIALAEDADIAATLETIRKGSPSECVEALGKLTPGKEERAAKPIATRLLTEGDAQARAALREALAAYKGQTLVQALKSGLESKSATDEFRTMACELLADEKSDAALGLVGKIAFESEMKAMRETGQKALVAYGDSSLKTIAKYVSNQEEKTAAEAIATFKAIGTEAAGKALTVYMPDGGQKEILRIAGITNKTRDLAAKALIDMGDNAVPGLLAGLDQALYQRWCGWCLQQMTKETFMVTDKAAWANWWAKRKAEKAGR